MVSSLYDGFRIHHRYITQVAIELFVIQAAAHHEAVGNFETAIIHRHLHNTAHRAIEQSADSERARLTPGQSLKKVTRGETGIDDVFDQQDVFVLHWMVQIFRDTHQPRL